MVVKRRIGTEKSEIGNPQEGTLTGTGAWFNQEEHFLKNCTN